MRRWRIVFACYALALFAATHWPSPSLPQVAAPLSDKVQHFLAFALWTWLMLLARVTPWGARGPRVWPALAVALAYAAVDEGLQMIPALRRSAEWADLGANALGACVAIALFVTARTGRTGGARAGSNAR